MVWRVSDRATLDALRKRSRRARFGPVTVAFCRVDEAPVARVAYAVGRRSGGAVERNRIRRRLRAVVGDAVGTLPPGAYMVWAGREALNMPYGALSEAVVRAMTLAGRGSADEDRVGKGCAGGDRNVCDERE